MKAKGIFFSIMAIMICCFMANAKLNVAYFSGVYGDEMPLQFGAKIRQAIIEAAGEDWLKQFARHWTWPNSDRTLGNPN